MVQAQLPTPRSIAQVEPESGPFDNNDVAAGGYGGQQPLRHPHHGDAGGGGAAQQRAGRQPRDGREAEEEKWEQEYRRQASEGNGYTHPGDVPMGHPSVPRVPPPDPTFDPKWSTARTTVGHCTALLLACSIFFASIIKKFSKVVRCGRRAGGEEENSSQPAAFYPPRARVYLSMYYYSTRAAFTRIGDTHFYSFHRTTA